MTTNAEAAAALYPAPDAPAKAPPNSPAAQTMYPSMDSGAPPKPTANAQAEDKRSVGEVLYPGPPPLPPGAPGFDKLAEDATPEEVATALYDDHPETLGPPVRWDEPAAAPGELKTVIEKAITGSDAFDPTADLPTLANAFATVGVGPTFAREAMMHAVFAASPAYEPMNPADVILELRTSWGKGFQANLTRVQTAVRTASDKDPRITQFLKQTGLGNDLAFIRKVHASLQRRRRA